MSQSYDWQCALWYQEHQGAPWRVSTLAVAHCTDCMDTHRLHSHDFLGEQGWVDCKWVCTPTGDEYGINREE